MSRRPMLPAVELRRFTGSPRALLALFAVVLVPLIYGGLYTWANESPQTKLDQRIGDHQVTARGAHQRVLKLRMH